MALDRVGPDATAETLDDTLAGGEANAASRDVRAMQPLERLEDPDEYSGLNPWPLSVTDMCQ